MKIPNHLNVKVNDAYLRHIRATERKSVRRIRETSESRKPEKDEIILSSHAAEVRQSEELARDIPDVRQQKIEAVKRQIESETYAVDSRLVARSIANFLG